MSAWLEIALVIVVVLVAATVGAFAFNSEFLEPLLPAALAAAGAYVLGRRP